MWDVGCEMWVCVLLVILDVRRETPTLATTWYRYRVTA